MAVITSDLRGVLRATLSPSFFDDFGRILKALDDDSTIKAAIMSFGEPESVPLDLRALEVPSTSAEAEALCRRGHGVALTLRGLKKPIVAALHGPTESDALALALACHARVAADDPGTFLRFPEVRLGLLPTLGGLQSLADKAGFHAAVAFGLTGEILPTHKAKELRIVDDVGSASTLEERCAALALRLASRPEGALRAARLGALDRATSDRNPLLRALLFRRTSKKLRQAPLAHYPAPARALDVLRAFAAAGLEASKEVEARAFGELAVSETAHRLSEIFAQGTLPRLPADAPPRAPRVELVRSADPRAIFAQKYGETPSIVAVQEDLGGYTARVFRAYLNEAARISNEGLPGERLDEALTAWGWSVGAMALLGHMESALIERFAPDWASRGLRREVPSDGDPTPEAIQMRCGLAFANEAARCFAGGLLSNPQEGDLLAVLGLGFPPFRGGPFRYVDAVGATEMVRRLEALRARFGPRFSPAPVLLDMARGGRRFYEDERLNR